MAITAPSINTNMHSYRLQNLLFHVRKVLQIKVANQNIRKKIVSKSQTRPMMYAKPG